MVCFVFLIVESQENPKQNNVSFSEYNLLGFLHTSHDNKLYFAMHQTIVLIFVIATIVIFVIATIATNVGVTEVIPYI